MQPLRTSATQRAATITPGLFAPVISVITITGIGDHLRPEWPITFTGMRTIWRSEPCFGSVC
jgi:hypothetical protein